MLLRLYGDTYLPNPWFRYRAGNELYWCQPDGLFIDPWKGDLRIVEVKYRHTLQCWEKMRAVYEPVVRAYFPADLWPTLSVLEICKWYEPGQEWPEPVEILSTAVQPTEKFGVYIWQP